jgi:hypothetical protein
MVDAPGREQNDSQNVNVNCVGGGSRYPTQIKMSSIRGIKQDGISFAFRFIAQDSK